MSPEALRSSRGFCFLQPDTFGQREAVKEQERRRLIGATGFACQSSDWYRAKCNSAVQRYQSVAKGRLLVFTLHDNVSHLLTFVVFVV